MRRLFAIYFRIGCDYLRTDSGAKTGVLTVAPSVAGEEWATGGWMEFVAIYFIGQTHAEPCLVETTLSIGKRWVKSMLSQMVPVTAAVISPGICRDG